MQPEFPADGLELCRLDQLAMRDAHRVQRSFKLLLPKGQEAMQLGKFGEEIVILPDVGLEQPAMIGTPIQYVRSRQAITTDLFTEILRNHFVLRRVGLKVSISGGTHCKPER